MSELLSPIHRLRALVDAFPVPVIPRNAVPAVFCLFVSILFVEEVVVCEFEKQLLIDIVIQGLDTNADIIAPAALTELTDNCRRRPFSVLILCSMCRASAWSLSIFSPRPLRAAFSSCRLCATSARYTHCTCRSPQVLIFFVAGLSCAVIPRRRSLSIVRLEQPMYAAISCGFNPAWK